MSEISEISQVHQSTAVPDDGISRLNNSPPSIMGMSSVKAWRKEASQSRIIGPSTSALIGTKARIDRRAASVADGSIFARPFDSRGGNELLSFEREAGRTAIWSQGNTGPPRPKGECREGAYTKVMTWVERSCFYRPPGSELLSRQARATNCRSQETLARGGAWHASIIRPRAGEKDTLPGPPQICSRRHLIPTTRFTPPP